MKTLHFHIGRGGRFHNPGHVSFHGEKTMSELLNFHSTYTSWENYAEIMDKVSDDEELSELLEKCFNASDFTEFETKTGMSLGKKICVDHNGDYIIDEDAETGTLNWDNDYDTDIIMNLADCEENDLKLILDSSEFGRHDLIEEYFNNYTDLNIDWKYFNGDYENLIYVYFNIPNIDVLDFYNVEETE